jgi:putative intracellular protease/amidase
MEYPASSRCDEISEFCTLSNFNTAKGSIGLLLSSGFEFPEVASVLEAFQAANALAQSDSACVGRPRYVVSLLSIAGGRIESSSSVFVWTESIENRRHAGGFHTVFVSGGVDTRHALRDERLIHWLCSARLRGVAVVPIGEGSLLLEAAGIYQAGKRGAQALRATGGLHYLGKDGFAETVDGLLHTVLTLIELDFGREFARATAARIMPRRQPTDFT